MRVLVVPLALLLACSTAPPADTTRPAAPSAPPADTTRPAAPSAPPAATPTPPAAPPPTAAAEIDAGRPRPALPELAGDPEALALAAELFDRWGTEVGVEPAHTMDGGYRGPIHIAPAPPIAKDRQHLAWVTAAFRDFEAFFAALDARAAAPGTTRRYRYRDLVVRFFRSTTGRTPSAYAGGATVAWNVVGSLHVSADAARETLFHEVFHLNDRWLAPAGAETWSGGALGRVWDGIVRRCGARTACLAPYAPSETQVRGGTYYAFQPGNDVGEYAAELALRYYREQRVALGLARGTVKPFKCGPPENRQAWELVRDAMFAGVDAVAPCGG